MASTAYETESCIAITKLWLVVETKVDEKLSILNSFIAKQSEAMDEFLWIWAKRR